MCEEYLKAKEDRNYTPDCIKCKSFRSYTDSTRFYFYCASKGKVHRFKLGEEEMEAYVSNVVVKASEEEKDIPKGFYCRFYF